MKNIFTKKNIVIFILCAVFLIGPLAHAQITTNYSLLVPIARETGDQTTVDPSKPIEYIQTLFRLAISLALVLAVLVIVYGGFLYMTTDAISQKKEGKEIIKRSLWGVVLILACVLILQIINPNVLNLNVFDFPALEGAPGIADLHCTPDDPVPQETGFYIHQVITELNNCRYDKYFLAATQTEAGCDTEARAPQPANTLAACFPVSNYFFKWVDKEGEHTSGNFTNLSLCKQAQFIQLNTGPNQPKVGDNADVGACAPKGSEFCFGYRSPSTNGQWRDNCQSTSSLCENKRIEVDGGIGPLGFITKPCI